MSGWDVVSILAKAFAYAATLSAAGGVFFLAYNHSLLLDEDRLQIRRLLGVLLGLAAFVSCARIAVLADSASDALAGMFDGSMISMLLDAGEGRATGLRLAGLLLASIAVISPRRPRILSVAGAAAAAASFAALGHAHAAARPALAMALLVIHLLCIAFWLGALAPLWLVAREGDLPRTARNVARFGGAAVQVVGVLVAAGAVLLAMLIASPSALWTSRYGRWLLVKLGLVACLLGFAAYNKLRLTPGIFAGDSQALRKLQRSLQAEMVLGALILTVTATFTTVMGPTAD